MQTDQVYDFNSTTIFRKKKLNNNNKKSYKRNNNFKESSYRRGGTYEQVRIIRRQLFLLIHTHILTYISIHKYICNYCCWCHCYFCGQYRKVSFFVALSHERIFIFIVCFVLGKRLWEWLYESKRSGCWSFRCCKCCAGFIASYSLSIVIHSPLSPFLFFYCFCFPLWFYQSIYDLFFYSLLLFIIRLTLHGVYV